MAEPTTVPLDSTTPYVTSERSAIDSVGATSTFHESGCDAAVNTPPAPPVSVADAVMVTGHRLAPSTWRVAPDGVRKHRRKPRDAAAGHAGGAGGRGERRGTVDDRGRVREGGGRSGSNWAGGGHRPWRPRAYVHRRDDERSHAGGARTRDNKRPTAPTAPHQGDKSVASVGSTEALRDLCAGRPCAPFEFLVEVHHSPLSVTAMRSNSRSWSPTAVARRSSASDR